MILAAQPARAQSITNGGLTPSDRFSLIPPGWTNLFGGDPNSTPDTEGATDPRELHNLSPDGESFVAGAHATLQPPTGNEGIRQSIVGLVVGQP